jgi:hypothetical protein
VANITMQFGGKPSFGNVVRNPVPLATTRAWSFEFNSN